jgi:hypothetical protein
MSCKTEEKSTTVLASSRCGTLHDSKYQRCISYASFHIMVLLIIRPHLTTVFSWRTKTQKLQCIAKVFVSALNKLQPISVIRWKHC